MKFSRNLTLVGITALLTGCGVSIPECGDIEAIELVKKIVNQQIFG